MLQVQVISLHELIYDINLIFIFSRYPRLLPLGKEKHTPARFLFTWDCHRQEPENDEDIKPETLSRDSGLIDDLSLCEWCQIQDMLVLVFVVVSFESCLLDETCLVLVSLLCPGSSVRQPPGGVVHLTQLLRVFIYPVGSVLLSDFDFVLLGTGIQVD